MHKISLKQALFALALGAAAVSSSSPVLAAAVDKERSESFLREANAYLKKGDVNAAIIQLKNALQNDPDNVAARRLLADLYLRANNGPAAEKELRGAIARGVKDTGLTLDLGRAYLLQGKFADVLNEIKPEGMEVDDRVEALMLRARANLGQRQIDEAARLFREANTLKPQDARPLIGLGQVMVNQGKPKEAEAEIDKALQRDPKAAEALVLKGELRRLDRDLEGAVAQFDKAIEVQPNNLLARLGRGAALVDLNRDDQAMTDIQAVFKAVPKHPLALYLQALVLAKKKDYAGARDALQESGSALDRHMPSVFLNGAVNYALGQLEQTVSYLSRYVAAVPGNLRARKLLAAAYLRQRDAVKAVETLEPALTDNASDAQLLTLLGTAYMQRGELNKGTELYEKAAELDPNAASIRTQLALGQLAKGEAGEAIESLQAAVDLDPDARQAGVMLALVKLRQRDFDGALKASEQLRKSDPSNPLALNLEGAAYLGKGETEKARAVFKEAIKLRSDFHPARMNLAQIELRENNLASAKAEYDEILKMNASHVGAMLGLSDIAAREKKADEAVSWLLKASAANPKAMEPRSRLINYYLASKEPQKALAVARELDQNLPNNAVVLEALGRVQTAANQPVDAVSTFQRLVQASRESPRAYSMLAGAQISAKDPRGAEESLRKAIKVDPNYIPGYASLVRLLLQRNDFDGAMQVANKVRVDQREKAAGDLLVGDIRMAQKKYGDAVIAYNAGLKKEDLSVLALRRYQAERSGGNEKQGLADLAKWNEAHKEASVRHALVSGYIAAARYDDAIREGEALLTSDQDNPIVLNNLAWLYQKKGDKRALPMAEKALERAPNSPAILDTLGWILVQQGEQRKGLEYLDKALAAAPKASDIRYHRAAALHRAGQTEKARKELEALLEEDPEFTERKDAEALLKSIAGRG